MRATIITLLVILSLANVTAQAAGQIDIRLVRAHDREGVSPELDDVAELLKNNLPFKGFQFLGRSRVGLPNRGQTVNLPERLEVRCSGNRERVQFVVKREKHTLLNAVIAPQNGKPVILGGFPDGNARLLLVVVVR